jgi:predicted nucleic acid-binding protein
VTTYFETSAIVKLLVAEEGSDRADVLWDSADLLATSELSYVETRAALAAANRSGRLTRNALAEAKDALEERFAHVHRVEVTPDVVRSAGNLAEDLSLRGHDAVHLASALALEDSHMILVTWDEDLFRAGNTVGFNLAGIGSA